MVVLQGGLTDLWLDDPYVVAASKLIKMAEYENTVGNVFPVRMQLFLPFDHASSVLSYLHAPYINLACSKTLMIDSQKGRQLHARSCSISLEVGECSGAFTC